MAADIKNSKKINEGKKNLDQKLHIQTLWRRITSGISQKGVLNQTLKEKTINAHTMIDHLQVQRGIINSL